MKRVLTMCLAVLMAFYLVPQTVRAEAATVNITVRADKAVANPGDTVNYEVMLGSVADLAALDFFLSIPEGLTLNGALTVPDGLRDVLKSDGDIGLNQGEYRWFYSTASENYTGTGEICILRFSCTVDADSAFETKAVSLKRLETCCDGSFNEFNVNFVPATLQVEKKVIAVSGVSLDKSSLSMLDGNTFKLTATVAPADADNKNVSWSSDNEAVATVASDGTVTAVRTGTANITVTTADGGKAASCAVSVSCRHAMTKTDAVAPTCDTDGNVEYWTCGKCNRKFADEAGSMELADTVVPARGHTGDTPGYDETGHWKICAVCGKGYDKTQHAYHWVVDQEATEDAAGLKHEVCDCGSVRSENTVIPQLDHTHTGIVHHEAVAANCTAKGNVEYWTCSSEKCRGKYYGDAACQTELAGIEMPIDPDHHVEDTGFWAYDDTGHWRVCAACGAGYGKTGHNYHWVVDQEATEDATGLKHEACDCGSVRSENTVIARLEHVHTGIVHHEAVAANCVAKGSVEYWTCSNEKCQGKYYGDAACQTVLTSIETPVDPNGHVYDNASDAECNLCGSKREVQQNTTDTQKPSQNQNGGGTDSSQSQQNPSGNPVVAQSQDNGTAPKTDDGTAPVLLAGLLMAVSALTAGGLYYKNKLCKKK